MKNRVQFGFLVIFLTVLGVLGYNAWLLETTPPERLYSDFLTDLQDGQIASVHLQGEEIRGEDRQGREFRTFSPDIPGLMPQLVKAKMTVSVEPPPSLFNQLAGIVFLIMAVVGLWLVFTKRSFGGGNSIWKDKRFQIRTGPGDTKTFADVAGIDEVREEVIEIVDFLKNHEKYNMLGGRIPRGVLLQGPPGTGKTLLARAIAGEASVPFYSIGGSDFVEMFAGVGASRVRELFGLAKKSAPCIIFIDEIDAIGSRRNGGSGGSHEEREQTLNAMLVEMDGFSSNETVIVIGATNRPDILDPALLRPGRFDRQLTVSLPNLHGRVRILEVHTRLVTVSSSLNLTLIAQGIPGFSGADIANLVNEAALIAARQKKNAVEMIDFEAAKDKILMGLERRNSAINEKERRIIAYHEAGHAIVARLLPETDELHKITIIPRGMALGLTQQVPFEERYTYSIVYLLSRIKVLLGGRIAEKIVFNHLSTGAANDIAAATDIACRLVCEWGMSSALGSTVYRRKQHQFLGDIDTKGDFSEATAREIDLEVRRIINECYEETEKLLRANNRLIHELAEVLLVNETIDAEEINIVMHCYENTEKIRKEQQKDRQRIGQQTPAADTIKEMRA